MEIQIHIASALSIILLSYLGNCTWVSLQCVIVAFPGPTHLHFVLFTPLNDILYVPGTTWYYHMIPVLLINTLHNHFY